MVGFVFRPRARRPRLSAAEVERRLKRLIDDPLYVSRRDREFQDYITRQFDRVYGTGPARTDASGRVIGSRPRRTDIEPFRPRVSPDDLKLGAPAGKGAANRVSDVLGLQKVLSKLGTYRFDIAEGERSGEATPRVVDAIKVFQKQNGLKVDGLINPAGETIKALGKRVDEAPAVGPPPRPPHRPDEAEEPEKPEEPDEPDEPDEPEEPEEPDEDEEPEESEEDKECANIEVRVKNQELEVRDFQEEIKETSKKNH